MKLTKTRVERVRPDPDRDVVVWDAELRCFGLRVKPSGRRTYIVQYRAEGRSRRMTLGRHGIITAEQARRKARVVLGTVAGGEDPASARDTARASPTMAALAERYLREHAIPHKKPSSVAGDEWLLNKYIVPALGTRRVQNVTRTDVAKLHHDLRETPYVGNRALALLSKMFSLAEQWGLRPDSSNPCQHVQRFKEAKRERFLSTDELTRLGQILAEADESGTEHPAAVTAIRLLIFTGCRRGEILDLRWEDIDWERGLLRIRDSKTGGRTVPLNTPAMEVLRSIEPGDSPWVIPGHKQGAHLVNLTKPWERIRVMADLRDVRLHDLRHSFAAAAAGAGQSLPIIGALLGHTQPQTTQRYAHLADDPVRAASEAVGAKLVAAMRGNPGKIVHLIRSR